MDTKKYLDVLKRRAYQEAGLIYQGTNEEGEMEFLGTDREWQMADELYEEKLLVNKEF